MTQYGCLVPFLNTTTDFACGIEIGMLFCRLKDELQNEIQNCYLNLNQDQIFLMLDNMGWKVVEFSQYDEHWFWLYALRIK